MTAGALRRLRRWTSGVVAAGSVLAGPHSLLAQRTPRAHVVLRLHPRVGDTLWTRLEQRTDVTRDDTGTSAVRPMWTSVTVLARTIVQASHESATTVLTVVDSADVHSSDAHGSAMETQVERALRGQQLLLVLATDGSVESARDARGRPIPRDAAETMAAMPAVLPNHAVQVGDRWERQMPLPSAGSLAGASGAQVRAVFRLDSLGADGSVAHVSMRGEIVSDGDRRGLELTGTMNGAMVVDRARGWMTESRFALELHSTLTPPGTAGPPMRFVTRVTQHLRTMDKR